MCKYTITILECGHKQNDHVDTYNCSYFERTSVPCDRDNPRTKDRCTIKTRDQNGICTRCLRENEEAAMRRDEEREREFKRREAEENAEALRRGERELLEKNRREAEQRRRAEREAEEEAIETSRREAERKRRAEKEAEEEALARSRREAERRRRAEKEAEEEALARSRKEAEQRRRAEKEAEEEAMARSRREHEKRMEAEEQALLKSRREHEKKMAAEQEAMARSRREHEKRMAEEEARTREIERQSKADYERQLQEQLERDRELMAQKSLEEAARKKKEEEEEMQRALRESARLAQSERSYQEDPARSTRSIPIRTAAPPSPPATPPQMNMPPPPPAPAPKPTVAKSAPRPPPAPKSAPPKEINYSLPAVGDQKLGLWTIGGRRVPIHESQDIPDTPTTSGIPMSPTSPAPFVRLGGAIAVSDVPVVRELKGQVPSVVPAAMDSRAGLRRTSGPRKVPPPVPERMGVDPKLQALLAKQRAWEPEDEDEKSKKTVTPPRSPSGGPEPTARRLSPSEFDTKRKTGWKKEEA